MKVILQTIISVKKKKKIFNRSPYSQFFNIIEEIFSQWKAYVKSKVPRTYKELIAA